MEQMLFCMDATFTFTSEIVETPKAENIWI